MSTHFWEAVCFLIFLILLYKPVTKFILSYLDKYSDNIKNKIIDSENIRVEAEKAIKFYEKRRDSLRQLVSEIYKNTTDNINKLLEVNQKKLELQIAIKMKMHEQKLKIYEKEQINEIKIEVLTKSLFIVQKYLTDNKPKKINDQYLSEVMDVTNNKKIMFH